MAARIAALPDLPMDESLMRTYLMDVLEGYRIAEGKSFDAIDAIARERGVKGMSKAAQSRRASEQTKAPRAGLDAVVEVYAEAFDVHPLVFWRLALDQWKADLETRGQMPASRRRIQARIRRQQPNG